MFFRQSAADETAPRVLAVRPVTPRGYFEMGAHASDYLQGRSLSGVGRTRHRTVEPKHLFKTEVVHITLTTVTF